ncbi:magnesium chelatase domain-containing protein, partial [Corynebacterium sp. LK2522]
MALGKCYTTALDGVLANVVTVEANIGAGLPGTHVVGLADAAITESRERMRTAVTNSQLRWPKTKIIISMSPASMPKSGSHFDLPMALAILVAAMGPEADLETGIDGASPAGRLASCLVLGELGLDGTVRGVPGVIPALLSARKHGYRTVLIPPDNAAEAALISDMNVLVAPTLERALAWV